MFQTTNQSVNPSTLSSAFLTSPIQHDPHIMPGISRWRSDQTEPANPSWALFLVGTFVDPQSTWISRSFNTKITTGWAPPDM